MVSMGDHQSYSGHVILPFHHRKGQPLHSRSVVAPELFQFAHFPAIKSYPNKNTRAVRICIGITIVELRDRSMT